MTSPLDALIQKAESVAGATLDMEPPKKDEEQAAKPKRRAKTKAKTAKTQLAAPSDPKMARLAAISDLIQAKGINQVTPVEVGTATVQTIGYTVWNEGLPTHYFMQPTDTPFTFKAEFNQQKQSNPMLEMGVVQCAMVGPEELNNCLFFGNLIADRNSGQGLIQVFMGAKVRIGALVTKNNNLRFVVLGVA